MWERALGAAPVASVLARASARGRRVLCLYEAGEPQVSAAVEEFLAGEPEGLEVSICARHREVVLEVAFKPAAETRAELLIKEVSERFRANVYSQGEDVTEVVAAALNRRGATLAVGESCTGGLLGGRITGVSGASQFFRGGVIAYHNDVKASMLGVMRQTLDSFGAVSEAVAQQMAIGARRSCGTDYGIGVTGIAGPSGGTEDKPVGLVFICVSSEAGDLVRRFDLPGGREDVRGASVTAALHMLRMKLDEDPG
jgi:nicotinamide-nucleotide amidase